jgi:hypothetical protein
LTIISTVTTALDCASAGIERSVARTKPAVAIEFFNGASLWFLILLGAYRNGDFGSGIIISYFGDNVAKTPRHIRRHCEPIRRAVYPVLTVYGGIEPEALPLRRH